MYERGTVAIKAHALKRGKHVVTVPVVAVKSRRHVEKALNSMLKQGIKAMLASAGWSNPAVEISGGFIVHVNEKNLLSLSQEVYARSQGVRDGVTTRHSLTVDTVAGRRYHLASLFREHSQYLVDLAAIIKAKGRVGTLPRMEHYYLTRDHLVLYFPVDSYSGTLVPVDYEIAYNQIARHISPTGPLVRLIGNSTTLTQ